MRVDTRSVPEITGGGTAAAAEIAPTAGAAGHSQTDAIGGATLSGDVSGKPASERDAFLDELRTATRALGPDFPAIIEGPYGLTPDGFSCPVGTSAQRAREHGIKQPRDFVLGEIGVHLGRAKLGYNRSSLGVSQNTTLRLVIELVETVHAARAITTRYPGLTEAVRSHITTIWSATADRAKAAGAPESIRTFVLTCLARAMGDGAKSPSNTLDDEAGKLIDAAAKIFDDLTQPPSIEAQERCDTDRDEAERTAQQRADRTREMLLPIFGGLIKLTMPAAPPASAGPVRSLMSAEEAIKRNQERIAKREESLEKQKEVAEAAAKTDSEKLLRGINSHELYKEFANPSQPTPSEMRVAMQFLVERDVLKEPANPHRTIELALRAKSQVKRPAFTVNAGGAAELPWSLGYMRRLAGPDIRAVLDAPVDTHPVEALQRPAPAGGVAGFFETKAKTTQARDWVTANTGRVSDLSSLTTFTAEFTADLDNHHGVTHHGITKDIAHRLRDLQRDITNAFDECRRTADTLAQGFKEEVAQTFAQARARVEALLAKHESIIGMLRTVTEEGGAVKRLLRLAAGQTGIDAQGLLAGIDRLLEAQQPARNYLDHIFKSFPQESRALADVLRPRLEWFDTAVRERASSNQSDPLLPLFDSAWLGTVTAELRRAELASDRILVFADHLPRTHREAVDIEIGSPERFQRAMLESACTRIAERLTGRSSNNDAGFDIAAVQSRALPALAARPRLYSLCASQKLIEATGDDIDEIREFGDLAMREADGASGYSIDAEQKREGRDALAARTNYSFWCRTFDLDAPASAFMDALIGWRTYQADALQQLVDGLDANHGDAVARSVADTAATARGVHGVEEVTGQELESRFLNIAHAKQRLASSPRALEDLSRYLDASTQPVTVLLKAASELHRASDKDAAAQLVTPWLSLSDARLRSAARECLAKLGGVKVEKIITEQIEAEGTSLAKVLALEDAALSAKTDWVIAPILALTDDKDPVVRAFAAYAFSCLSDRADDLLGNAVAAAIVPLLAHTDPHVVQFTADGLAALTGKGNAYAAKRVVDWAVKNRTGDPQVADLLEAIADSPKLIGKITAEARGAAAAVRETAKAAGTKAPRRVVLKRQQAPKTGQRDFSEVMLSAAGAMASERSIDAVSDRVKLALRLTTRFNDWKLTVGPQLKPALDRLDDAEGIVDDAVAELLGQEPRGHLSKSPELVSELLSTPGFSAAEVAVLEHGRVPEALVALTKHPTALDGSWRTTKLASAYGDTARFEALVKLKLSLSTDLPGVVSDVIAIILDDKTPAAIAAVAYEALTQALTCDIPLLDPRLDPAQRQEALGKAKPLVPAVETLVERAVVDRLAVVDAAGDEAKLLVSYLASGSPGVADRRLSAALERATSEPQAALIIEACRARCKGRRVQSGNGLDTMPWLVALLMASSRASIDQIIAVRDARLAAVQSSDAGSVDRAGERVTALAASILDVREDIPAAELAPLLAVIADSEDDGSRLAKIDGLKLLMRNTSLKWSPERMMALRHGLLVVQENRGYNVVGGVLELAIRFAGNMLVASPTIAEADLGKLFEILARCRTMKARDAFAENIVKIYRLLEARGEKVSMAFLGTLGDWLAAADTLKGDVEETELARSAILRGLLELVPITDDTMAQLAKSCAGMSYARTSEVLGLFRNHKRQAPLTAADVERIAAKGATAEENQSIFKALLGAAVSLSLWKPSEGSASSDPLAFSYRDAREVETAKRDLRRSLGDIFNELAASRGETVAVPVPTISDDVGPSMFGAWAQEANDVRERDPVAASAYQAGAISKLLSGGTYEANVAAANAIRDAARAKQLNGKHDIEKMAAGMLENSRAVATQLDALFGEVPAKKWTLARPGEPAPRIDPARYSRALVQQAAYVAAAEKAEAAGLPAPAAFAMPAYGLKPARKVGSNRVFNIYFGLVIDNSDSTKEGKRLAYFKQLAVLLVNAFGLTKKVNIHCAVVNFSAQGHLIMPPRLKHDMQTMVQALGPLAPESNTNLVDGLDKSKVAALKGDYDLIVHGVCTDGQPNDVTSSIAMVQVLRQLKHTVVGFGVGPDGADLEKIFGDHFVAESDPSRLAPRMYHYLKDEVFNVLAR